MKQLRSNENAKNKAKRPPSRTTGFVRLASILAPLDRSRSAARHGGQASRSGRFPKPVKLGPRTTVWKVDDIRNLIEKADVAMARRHNGRRVKIHRSYTITELAAALGRAQAHGWPMDRGWTPTTDDKRPLLIHGEDIRAFMKAREPNKQTCRPGEFYCLSCRVPKRPAGDMADYIPRTPVARRCCAASARLAERMIYRAASSPTIEEIGGRNRRHIADGGATHSRYFLPPLQC